MSQEETDAYEDAMPHFCCPPDAVGVLFDAYRNYTNLRKRQIRLESKHPETETSANRRVRPCGCFIDQSQTETIANLTTLLESIAKGIKTLAALIGFEEHAEALLKTIEP